MITYHTNVTNCHYQRYLQSAFRQLFVWQKLTSWFPGFSTLHGISVIRILLRCVVFVCVIIHIIYHPCSALWLEYPVSKEEIYFERSLNGTHYETLPTYSYISPGYKAHKAFTFSFRPFWFAARALRVGHDCHPTVCLHQTSLSLCFSAKPVLMKRYETWTMRTWPLPEIS